MSKVEEKAFLRRTRATWLAEKLDINFARANAILNSQVTPTIKQKKKISKIVRKEMRAPLHKGYRKPL